MSSGSPTRFAILAAPRTGSNLLCTLLGSHPRILCHHELFNPRGIFYDLRHRDGSLDLGTVSERDRDPLGFLERVWQSGRMAPCVGFKMTRGQAPAVLERVLEDDEIKKIVLQRKNRLKTFVSTRIAEEIDQWEVYSEEELLRERPRVRVDRAELEAHAELNARYYAEIKAALERRGQTSLDLHYERLEDSTEQSRLLRFLGVEPAPLEPRSIKQNSTDLRDLVLDFEALDRELSGTPFHEELHDLGR